MRIKLTNQVSGTNFRFKKDKKACILSSCRKILRRKKKEKEKVREKKCDKDRDLEIETYRKKERQKEGKAERKKG